MKSIIIENEKIGEVKAKLLLDKNPKTCQAIWDALPFDVNLSRWGEELYGAIPVKIEEENPQLECEIGDIGYWMQGSGFCIFFGKTPVSRSNKPRAASVVNIFAKILDDPMIFKQFNAFKGRVRKEEA
ncbi:MAG: DUF3830 family protein [Candidatus Lokiarchaeota archaeon]|nr:DUF3830 family protein [Candidatus Lokiarchaeota archaeon]